VPAVFRAFFIGSFGPDDLKRHTDYSFVFRRISRISVFLLGLAGLSVPLAAQQPAPGGIIRGVVVDVATAGPLARVLVTDEGSNVSAVTDAEGRFELRVPAGVRRILASVVGYSLAQREVDLTPGGVVDVTIGLVGGTGAYAETVTVSADLFRSADPGAPTQYVLNSGDIQNLRGVLADDPLRAVQVLPGVATGDDLRSEFSVRGSNFSHMHMTVDGFTTPYLLHAVRAVEDESSSGSIAMINSDVLQDVALVSGGYVQRSGNRTGASVQFNMRPGTRDHLQVRGAVSGTGVSAVVEGPLGRAQRGSWLASARQSYLDLLIDRLVDDQVTFGFSDAQAKFLYDLTSRQRAELTVIAGRSRLKEPPEEVSDNDLFVGLNASAVAIGTWQLTTGGSVYRVGLLGGINRFRNETSTGARLDSGTDQQIASRFDARHQVAASFQIEAGGEVHFVRESRRRQRPTGATTYRVVNDYSDDATRVGAYGMARWAAARSFTLLPGVRIDRWSLTDEVTVSPWLQTEWSVSPAVSVRGAVGVYQQFPDFEEIVGAWGTPGLTPERAFHVDIGVQRTLGQSARVQVAIYDREERDFIRRPGAESRIVDGVLVRGSISAKYENRLDGHARGIELLVQRLDANGFSGWISYAYGRNRYRDTTTEEIFWGDLDQRHTMNLYALYRLSPRMSVSGKLRMGSNFPAPGYYTESGGRFFLGPERNDVRLPSFARLDVRANRTFTWSSRRLTLFVEVVNVLNRENVRYHPPSIDGRTLEARRLFESLLPVVPSAGVLIEF
jgi:hypothetical protein